MNIYVDFLNGDEREPAILNRVPTEEAEVKP